MSDISVSSDFERLCRNLRMSEDVVSKVQNRDHMVVGQASIQVILILS